ncbi:hypothetical protein BaRGS_00031207 [Batillaria attramentaria]|uniref:Uncharacterized protein n=1 Tax=Batillaria attramentaria TaxID=370345 RepID=A0ABD0JRK8_9CAEN
MRNSPRDPKFLVKKLLSKARVCEVGPSPNDVQVPTLTAASQSQHSYYSAPWEGGCMLATPVREMLLENHTTTLLPRAVPVL